MLLSQFDDISAHNDKQEVILVSNHHDDDDETDHIAAEACKGSHILQRYVKCSI